MAEVLLGGKKLVELKVSELKAELEKRDLHRKGIKSVLLTRLKNAILREALTSGDADEGDNSMDLDCSQAEGSFSDEDDSQQHMSSSEDHEPLANTPTHELDPGHMSGAEEAPPTVNPAPAVVPSPDESAKEGNEESPQEEEEEEEEEEAKEEDNDEDNDEVLVGVSEKRGAALTERMDSVTIDPSFNPSGEELLYEGDMDAETAPLKLAAEKDNSSQDEGFIVNVHETSMELDMTESLTSHSKAATTTNCSSVGGSGSSNSENKGSVHSSKHSADKGGTNSKVTPSSGKSVSSSERKKQESSSTSGKTVDRCSLWVSGLMPSVRALDLQTLFSPYAQVVSAKVVAKSRTKQLRFGFITVATPEEAQRCIKELNGTELKGKKITVELSKSQPPLNKIASSGTKPSISSNSREKPGASDKKQASSSSSKNIIKRSEGGKTSTGSSGKSLADRIVERSRRSMEMRKVTTLTNNKERDNRRKSAPLVQRPRSHSREHVSRLTGTRRPAARPFSRSPPRPPHGPGHVSVHSRLGAMPRNAEVLQREMAERDMFMRDRERQVEMQRMERNHEIQRQLEVERRREQDMAHHMQELRDRELREREIRERQLIEQERMFKEKERELREREYRERQRREALERELRERQVREHHMREREKRMKEIHDKEIRDREVRALKEREMRDRDTRMQMERERELCERERRLKAEQERVDRDRRVREEQQRWMREEAARAKAETIRLQKEREDSERRERERRQREEKEKRQQEELQLKRERERDQKREREEMEKRMQPDSGSGRLGKRPYQDNGGYDAKRQAFSDSYGAPNSSSIFNRLDHKSGRSGPSHQMGGSGMGPPSSSIQPGDLPHVNPEIISAATQALENIRKSVPSVSGNLPSSRGSASLQAQIQQLAAATALASSVGGRGGVGMDYHGGGGMVPQSQQYPPNLMRQSMNMRPQGGGGMAMLNKSSHIGGGMGGGGMGKLPPEDQRYNRRLGGSRSGGGGGGYRGHPGRQGGPPGRQGGGY